MKKIFIFCTFIFTFLSITAYSCTGISIKTKDNKMIQARTIEFGEYNLNSRIVVSPRGKKFQSLTPSGKEDGYKWKAKYGFVGASVVYDKFIGEGINEAGLNAGLFYFPHYGSLAKFNPKDKENSIADMEVVGWILSSFSTVEEVKNGLKKIKIVNIAYDEKGNPLPTAHWRIADAKGNNIVLEIVNGGEVKIYENKAGVVTNAPDYEWHIKNLNNYVNLYAGDAKSYERNGQKIFSFGSGTGALGLPGDITPPSRFVRAFFYLNSSRIPENSYEGITQAFHIMNNFDIPIGIEYPLEHKDKIPKNLPSATQWTAVSNLSDREFYYTTMNNSQIRKIDLKKIDFGTVKYKSVPMDKDDRQNIEEIKF